MEYTKQNFENGQVLGAEPLNSMDDGIASAVEIINNLVREIKRYEPIYLDPQTLSNALEQTLENGYVEPQFLEDELGLTQEKLNNILDGYCRTIKVGDEVFFVTLAQRYGPGMRFSDIYFSCSVLTGSGLDSHQTYSILSNNAGPGYKVIKEEL